MAYTPINWQTGDTITAEKLNRCDNGWSVGTTELFSETVTTADEGDGPAAMLTYSSVIDAPTLNVTFDGVEYTTSATDSGTENIYGGFSEFGPDFSVYPFVLVCAHSGQYNVVMTETAGTYTIAAGTSSVEVSTEFSSAVAAVSNGSLSPMLCVHEVTTADDIAAANAASRMMYFFNEGELYIVRKANVDPGNTSAISFFPESNEFTAGFSIDGKFVVYGS